MYDFTQRLHVNIISYKIIAEIMLHIFSDQCRREETERKMRNGSSFRLLRCTHGIIEIDTHD